MINPTLNPLSLKDISCLLFTLNQSVNSHAKQVAPLQLDKIQQYTKTDKFYILINYLRSKKTSKQDCFQSFYFPDAAQQFFINYPFNHNTHFAIGQVCQRRLFHANDFSDSQVVVNSSYRALYLSAQHERQSQWVLINHDRYDSFYLFERLASQPPFSQRDHELIALLLPHLSVYLHSFQGNSQPIPLLDLYQRVLDCSDKGLAVCNTHAQPIVVNKQLSQQIKQSSQLSIEQYCLTIQENLLCKQFHAYIKQCCVSEASQPLSLEWFDEQQGVGITINPLNIEHQHHGYVCLVVFDYQQQLNWSIITKEYQLTRKELALVQAIYQQHSLRQIAKNRQVSYNTLRSHLQHIFKKMAVHGQAQVIAKLNLFKGL